MGACMLVKSLKVFAGFFAIILLSFLMIPADVLAFGTTSNYETLIWASERPDAGYNTIYSAELYSGVWTGPQAAWNPGDASNHSSVTAAVDSNNNRRYSFYRTVDDRIYWDAGTNIATADSDPSLKRRPVMAVSDDDIFGLAWSELEGANWNIHYTDSYNVGGVYSINEAADHGYAGLTFDRYNNPFIAYYRSGSMYVSRFINRMSWSTDNLGSISDGDRYAPDIERDNDGAPSVVWASGAVIYFRNWTGSAWSATSTVTSQGYSPRIAFDINNTPFVAYYSTSGDNRIHVARFTGGVWADSTVSSTISTYFNDRSPRIAVDNKGYPAIVWSQYNTNNYWNIYYSKWNGTAWSAPSQTNPQDVHQTYPSLVFDFNNNPIISYLWGGSVSRVAVARWVSGAWANAIVAGTNTAYAPEDTDTQARSLAPVLLPAKNLAVTVVNENGAPMSKTLVTVYQAGTSNVMCQGYTNSMGIKKCPTNDSASYDIKAGDYGAWLYSVSSPGKVRLVKYASAVTIQGLNMTFQYATSAAISGKRVTVATNASSLYSPQIFDEPNHQYVSSMVADRNNVPFIAYRSDTLSRDFAVRVAQMTDGSWKQNKLLSDMYTTATDYSSLPRLALDRNNNLKGVVWMGSYRGDYNTIFYSERDSATNTWTYGVPINPTANSQSAPEIVYDSNNRQFISYYDAASDRILVTRWTGAVWTTDTISSLNSEPAWEQFARMAVDNNGNPAVVWSQNDGTYWEIWYRKWNGASWDAAAQVSPNDAFHYYSPTLVFDAANNAYVSYFKSDNTAQVARTGAWTNATVSTFTSGSGEAYSPKLSRDPSGTVWVSWAQYNPTSQWNIYYSKWSGASWDPAKSIRSENNQQYYPSKFVFDSANVPYISFYRAAGTSIYAARLADGGWSGKDVSTGTSSYGMPYGPVMAVDNSSNPLLAWSQQDTSYWSAYFLRWNGTAWGNASYSWESGQPACEAKTNSGGMLKCGVDASKTYVAAIDNYTINGFNSPTLNGILRSLSPGQATFKILNISFIPAKGFTDSRNYLSGTQITVYDTGTSNVACQGITDKNGVVQCVLNSSKTYDVMVGGFGSAALGLATAQSVALRPITVTVSDSAGSPASGAAVAVYNAGTSTLACQGNTGSSGVFSCVIDQSLSVDIKAGNYGAMYYSGTPIISQGPSQSSALNVRLINYSSSTALQNLQVALKDYNGAILKDAPVTVFEAGTSIVACSGKTYNVTGIMTCGLNSSRRYDIRAGETGPWVYNRSVPNTATLTILKDVGVAKQQSSRIQYRALNTVQINVDGTVTSYGPNIVFDSSNNAFVAFNRDSTNLRVSRQSGGSWVAEQVISTTSSPSGFRSYSMAAGTNGYTGIAFRQNNPSSVMNIYYREWSGASWGSVDAVNLQSGVIQYHPVLALNSNNDAFAAYMMNSRIYAAVKPAGGIGWANFQIGTSTSDTNIYSAPNIAIDNNGYPAVVWSQYNPTSYWNIYYSKWNGVSWSAAVQIYAQSTVHQYSPSIVFDKDNKPFVVWMGPSSVHVTRFDGAWQDSVVSVGNMPGTNSWEYIPRIVKDRNGYPAVVWGEVDKGNNNYYRPYYSRWDSTAWSAPESPNYDASHSYAPELAFDPSGFPIITTTTGAYVGRGSSWSLDESYGTDSTTWDYAPRIASKPVSYDSINVTVKSSGGVPRSGVSVAIYDAVTPEASSPICVGITDVSGGMRCGLNKYKTYNVYVNGVSAYTGLAIPNSIEVSTDTPQSTAGSEDVTFTLLDSSGNAVSGQQITTYEAGTSTVGCGGSTDSSGQMVCALQNSSKTYEAYLGTRSAGTLFYVANPGGQIKTINDTAYVNWLNITLRDSFGNAVSGQQITTYESGTSTIACQGRTGASGQLKCSINSSKTYEAYLGTRSAGTLFYVAKPAGHIWTPVRPDYVNWLNITLRDSAGNAVPGQQVTAYSVATKAWTTDMMDSTLNSDTRYEWSYAPQIATAPNGNTGVIWSEMSPTYHRIRYREWNGNTWTDMGGDSYQIRVVNEHQYSEQLAFDNNSYPFITYFTDNAEAIRVTRWTGSAWTTDTIASNANGGNRAANWDSAPRIARAPNGNIGVVWGEYRTGESYLNIRYTEWNGNAWTNYTTNQKVYGQTSHQRAPEIAFDSNSRPFVVFHTQEVGDAIMVSRWTGGSWTTDMMDSTLNSDTLYAWGSAPQIARAPNGNIGVIWTEMSPTYYRIRYREWTGSSWSDMGNSNSYQIRVVNEHQYSEEIAFDSNSRPFITYFTDNADAIRVTRWTGSAWTTDTIASNANGGDRGSEWDYAPRIARAPNGNIGVIWSELSEYRTGESYWNIRYTEWDETATAWTNYIYINQKVYGQTSHQRAPEIAFDSNSRPFVVFHTQEVGDAIMVAKGETQQVGCQGNTNSAGQLKCTLDSTTNYSVQTQYGVYIYIYNLSVSNALDMLRYSSATTLGTLTVALKDSTGSAVSEQNISVYESGTSTLACQGNTNSAGQLNCALDSTKNYDIQTQYGAHVYGSAAANTVNILRYTASTALGNITLTLKDMSGNAIANKQVIIYESGTSTVACSENTNSAGQIKCALDKGKSYNIQVPYMQKTITNVNIPYSAVITSEIQAAPEVQAALLSLSGTVKYLNNSLVSRGSFRIEVKDSTAANVWGPYIFNNTVVNGEFGIVLGGENILQLMPYARYRIEIAFCDLIAFNETAGQCVPGTSHYDLFTTYFKG